MNLTEEQKQQVVGWVKEGLKLSDIQKLINDRFSLKMTYLETRLLVDDLKVVPKDQERPAPKPETALDTSAAANPAKPVGPAPATPAQPAGVSVSVDSVTRPGAVVSGRVNFSDGKQAEWFMDEYGRLGLAPQEQGYRPSQADMQAFQRELQREFQKMEGTGF